MINQTKRSLLTLALATLGAVSAWNAVAASTEAEDLAKVQAKWKLKHKKEALKKQFKQENDARKREQKIKMLNLELSNTLKK